MPRFNTRGQSVCGVGDGIVGIVELVNGQRQVSIVGAGGCANWLDDDRIIFGGQKDGRWQLLVYDHRTPTVPPQTFVDTPVNFICGSGGEWGAVGAGFIGSVPVGPQWRLSLSDTDNRGAGDRVGTLALTHQDGLGFSLFSRGGFRVDVAPGVAAYHLTVINLNQAIWPNGRGGYDAISVTPPKVAAPPGRGCWCDVAGVTWLVTWYEGIGLCAHPVTDASRGVIIGREPLYFHYDAIGIDGRLLVTWSTSPSERPDMTQVLDVDMTNLVPLEVAVNVEHVGRPLWLGFFEFAVGDPGSVTSPGNCSLLVRGASGVAGGRPVIVTSETVDSVSGSILGQFIGSTSGRVEEIEAAANASRYRPIAYWDARAWPRLPVLPDGSWLCQQVYQWRDESVTALEQDIDQRLENMPPGQPIALVVQCYTSNVFLTNELRPIVGAVSRLVNRHSNVVAVLIFSGPGRKSGLGDHPEVRPLWEAFARNLRKPELQEYSGMAVRPVITINDYAKTLRPNVATRLVSMRIGDTDVVVRLDANSNLFVDASNGAGDEHTGRPDRHIEIGGGPVVTPTPVPQPTPPVVQPPTTQKVVSFATVTGHLLFVDANDQIVATQTTETDRSRFVVDWHDDKISLKSVATGKYVSAAAGGGREMIVKSTVVGPFELFRVHDAHGAIALSGTDGRFVSPQHGGGGAVLVDGPAVGPWEPLLPSVPLTSGGRVGAGIVRASGRMFVDDRGAFAPLGTSLFWGLWGWEHDRARLQRNLSTARDSGCDYTRDFGDVGGGSWSDREIRPANANYRDLLASYLDEKFGRYGLRTALTLFAGGTGTDPRVARDKIVDAVRGREQSILYFEVANEAFQNFTDRDLLRSLVRDLRSAFPTMLVASSSPAPGSPLTPESFDLDVANLFTFHIERDHGDQDWRQARQPVDIYDLPCPGDNAEGPGLQSSGAMLSNPLRLAVIRGVSISSGMPAFILHTGAGVRGGGAADVNQSNPPREYLPRKANLYEYAELPAIAAVLRNVGDLVPVESSNWRKTKGHWVDTPLRSDVIWVDDPDRFDHGCVRVYGSYSDRAFVEHVFGVRRFVNLAAVNGSWHVRAYDVLTKRLAFEGDVAQGQTFRLDGHPETGPGPTDADSDTAYIVLGSR